MRLVGSCLEPGVSVSRLALDNGVNANLLRKWIKAAKEAGTVPSSSAPAFVPVLAVDSSSPMQTSTICCLSTSRKQLPPDLTGRSLIRTRPNKSTASTCWEMSACTQGL
ncbi:transposase [uncultured Roseibium sp.]|uniref:transposase n=1 Tax=uncultured Roseibium sp. TaxID=1936171 RepID=UPI003434E25D